MASQLRAGKIVDFLEAAYDFESADRAWVERVMESLCSVWQRGAALHGALYDARDIHDFRLSNVHLAGFTPEGVDCILGNAARIPPSLVSRAFRRLVVAMQEAALPEMKGMHDALAALGFENTLYLNSLDPERLGMLVGIWSREKAPAPEQDLAVFRRLAHHLAAAYRCRRRLRTSEDVDATNGAAAILDTRLRVIHAEGEAKTAEERARLVRNAAARDRAHTKHGEVKERLSRFHPLTSARWTLIDVYERNGTRYIVARENQARLQGVAKLSGREQQVLAYVAGGQSTKETAYALGISASTVRVLLARAGAKLGAKTRRDLLLHPDVRKLRPEGDH
jgi:DNA-binding CsgD family transcriptional regulator